VDHDPPRRRLDDPGPARPARPSIHPVERGDVVELDVVGLGEGPDGVGNVVGADSSYVVFVPGTLPGERVRARITAAGRKFARGVVEELEVRAEDRVEAACRHFLQCGGCHRQHQAYPSQLADKSARLQRALDFVLGDAAPTVAEALPARPPYGQRHKVALHLRGGGRSLSAGFHRLRSPDLVPIHECPASDPLAWDLATDAVRALSRLDHAAWDPDFAPDGLLRSVLVRATTTGAAHLILVARNPFVPGIRLILDSLHEAGATTVSINHNPGELSQLLGPRTTLVSGPERIEERIGETNYLLSATSFFQTSPQAAGDLVAEVLAWLDPRPDDLVADLYCGVGLFALPLAARCRHVLGVEVSEIAVFDAEASAELAGIDNVTFVSGPVERALRRCGNEVPAPHLMVVDPPRSGLSESVVEQLGRLRPRRLAYVSCDLRALQRDVGELQEVGFVLRGARVVDMFPQTSHVEAFAWFEAAGD
jgi:23S rRNA (uracil1939-C5)-methyltransferase